MLTLTARNANQALPEMMHQLKTNELAVQRDSRNGPVIQFCQPFTIQYQRPTERVVYWPERDANPFFHLFESLWMLAGRNDVEYPARYSSNIGQFSDDGATFHGAYGYRWRRHFQINPVNSVPTYIPQRIDQLLTIAQALKKNPEDRRQVLQMWDAGSDLGGQGKDLPCNLMITFQRDHEGRLNMCVYNRSNDIVWGALGANCVHMSYLQEYMAARIGCPVGQYWQISANMHGYIKTTEQCLALADKAFPSGQYHDLDPYQLGEAKTYPLITTDPDQWDSECRMFLEEPYAVGYRDSFFRRVAIPMARAYDAFKQQSAGLDRYRNALNELNSMAACDWQIACVEWISRRWEKAIEKSKQTKTEPE